MPIHGRRTAFTLIELLVAMGIMLVLASMVALALSSWQNSKQKSDAVDRLSQWLLTAKQRAKRDGVPTGVRFLFDPTTNLCNQVQYIQQPDDFRGGALTTGMCLGAEWDKMPVPSFGFVPFLIPGMVSTPVDFFGSALTPDQWLVQPGDYLELYGGGEIYQIVAVNPGSPPPPPVPTPPDPPLPPPLNQPFPMQASYLTVSLKGSTRLTQSRYQTTNYRIIRQPRPVMGEDLQTLPQGMVVNLNNIAGSATNPLWSKNIPVRTVLGGPTFFEVLFSPSGALMGQGVNSGQVYLWLNVDPNVDPNADPNVNPQADGSAIVAIQVRTGYIASHGVAPFNPAQPIAPGNDPFSFSYDGRSSGL